MTEIPFRVIVSINNGLLKLTVVKKAYKCVTHCWYSRPFIRSHRHVTRGWFRSQPPYFLCTLRYSVFHFRGRITFRKIGLIWDVVGKLDYINKLIAFNFHMERIYVPGTTGLHMKEKNGWRIDK